MSSPPGFDTSVFRHETSAEELVDAHSRIANAIADADLEDDVIAQLEREVQEAKLRRAKKLHLADYNRGIITLARRVPLEVLASIFMHCVDGGHEDFPLVASHVCSQPFCFSTSISYQSLTTPCSTESYSCHLIYSEDCDSLESIAASMIDLHCSCIQAQ